MTSTEVTSYSEHGPYQPVNSTGGFETFTAKIAGTPKNISFAFSDGKLAYIQIFNYEGKNRQSAKDAIRSTAKEWTEKFGGVRIKNIRMGDSDVLPLAAIDALLSRFYEGLVDHGEKSLNGEAYITALFDMDPAVQPKDCSLRLVFGYLGNSKDYVVYKFHDPAASRRKYNEPSIAIRNFSQETHSK